MRVLEMETLEVDVRVLEMEALDVDVPDVLKVVVVDDSVVA